MTPKQAWSWKCPHRTKHLLVQQTAATLLTFLCPITSMPLGTLTTLTTWAAFTPEPKYFSVGCQVLSGWPQSMSLTIKHLAHWRWVFFNFIICYLPKNCKFTPGNPYLATLLLLKSAAVFGSNCDYTPHCSRLQRWSMYGSSPPIGNQDVHNPQENPSRECARRQRCKAESSCVNITLGFVFVCFVKFESQSCWIIFKLTLPNTKVAQPTYKQCRLHQRGTSLWLPEGLRGISCVKMRKKIFHLSHYGLFACCLEEEQQQKSSQCYDDTRYQTKSFLTILLND